MRFVTVLLLSTIMMFGLSSAHNMEDDLFCPPGNSTFCYELDPYDCCAYVLTEFGTNWSDKYTEYKCMNITYIKENTDENGVFLFNGIRTTMKCNYTLSTSTGQMLLAIGIAVTSLFVAYSL